MSFGFGFGFTKITAAIRAAFSPAFSPASLFANNEPGVWLDPSDFSTMFQDAAGTVPVTAVEQPVGLMLDKSKGLVLGPELVVNGDGSSTTGWSIVAGSGALSVVDGNLRITSSSTVQVVARQNVTTVVGKWYRFSATVYGAAACGGQVNTPYFDSGTQTTTKTISYLFLAVGTSTRVDLIAVSDQAGEFTDFDNISVRELPGNHARQPTTTSRPVLSARVNLLTKTEQFGDGVWSKSNLTVTSNTTATTDPLGGNTADLIYPSSSGSNRFLYQALGITGALTRSVVVKAAGKSIFYMDLTGAGTQHAYFDLASGTVGSVQSGYTASIESLGNGWFRCTASNYASIPYSFGGVYGVADANGSTTVTASGTSGIYIWGASLVSADQAHLPYQRVNTATDYDTAGFPHYLRFDGVDDWLVTPIITPGIDKVQVFAGVRKLSDAAAGSVVETGNTYWTVNGFSVLAPSTPTLADASLPLANYSAAAGDGAGTQNQDFDVFVTQNVYPSPITSTISAVFDRGAAPLSKTNLRVNGVVPTKVTGSFTGTAVTGNVLNTPLYIGRRGGTELPFNGHLYSLIVRFGSNLPIETIENTENYINTKTRAF